MISLESADDESFAPFIGRTFTVTTVAGQIELRLDAVDLLGHRQPAASRDPFSLVFRGAPGLRLEQSIYPIACEGFGKIEIFITQIGGGSGESEFEAVFT